jgi:hypothetical protein
VRLKVGSKTGLRYFDIKYLRSIDPCYDPSRYLKEDFRGTVLTILNNSEIPAVDRLWVVLRTDLVSEKLIRLFAVWCAREAIKLVPNPDPRLEACCAVAERHALGQATEEELRAAWVAACRIVQNAAQSVAWSVAGAAWSAARSAARSAAWSAAWSAAESVAAESAARSAQVERLKTMVVAEGLERVSSRRSR